MHSIIFALLAGGITVFILPPFFILPLLPLALIFLYLALESSNDRRKIFRLGCIYGFASFCSSGSFAPVTIFMGGIKFLPFLLAMLLFACVFSTIYGVLALIYYRLKTATAAKNMLLLALLLCAGEWLINPFMPWHSIGTAVSFYPPLMFYAQFLGLSGLSLLLFLLAVCFALPSWRSWSAGIFIFAALVLLAMRMLPPLHSPPSENAVFMRIIQPGLVFAPGSLDESYDARLARFHDLQKFSASYPEADVTLWPEYALPAILTPNNKRLFAQMMESAYAKNQLLILGIARSNDEQEASKAKQWNSIIMFDRKGTEIASYDKRRPMPFGEYIPLAKLFPFLLPVATFDNQPIAPGDKNSSVLKTDVLPPFFVKICYELASPFHENETQMQEGRFTLAFTSDSWFANSTEPAMNFSFAQIRAAETARPLVRSSKSGTSAFIDRYGRVENALGFGKRGALYGHVEPVKAGEPISFYMRFPWLAYLCWGILIGAFIFLSMRKRINVL